MAEKARNDKIVKYVSELAKDTTADMLINSNNVSVDAILNQKYTKAAGESDCFFHNRIPFTAVCPAVGSYGTAF